MSPIILLVGLKFTPYIKRFSLVLFPLTLRFGLGAFVGLLFIHIAGLEGLDASIVFFASVAPIGMNTMTFADMEKLDTEIAASMVSVAIFLAMLFAPLSLHIASGF